MYFIAEDIFKEWRRAGTSSGVAVFLMKFSCCWWCDKFTLQCQEAKQTIDLEIAFVWVQIFSTILEIVSQMFHRKMIEFTTRSCVLFQFMLPHNQNIIYVSLEVNFSHTFFPFEMEIEFISSYFLATSCV